jgi:hypothetical protein
MRRRTSPALLLLLVAACSGGGDHSGDATTTLTHVATITLAAGAYSGPLTVDAPPGSVSLSILAVTPDAGDMDISSIVDPTGVALVSDAAAADAIGYSSAQAAGDSAVMLTLPHSRAYPFHTGTFTYDIRHYDSPDGAPRTVDIYTMVKSGLAAALDVNIFLVALPDYTGAGDPALAALIDAFRTSLSHLGLTLGEVNVVELTGEPAATLTYVGVNEDVNANGQPDDMERLFALSGDVGNRYLNLFLVRSIGAGGGILGIAGGIPGPQLVQGTVHSGVVVTTFGGLHELHPADVTLQADTMAHELGHYLGLYHTTERGGTWFDPIGDTPECAAATYDKNRDGVVSAAECENRDGPNIMFWSAAAYPQVTTSADQRYVLSVAPATR